MRASFTDQALQRWYMDWFRHMEKYTECGGNYLKKLNKRICIPKLL